MTEIEIAFECIDCDGQFDEMDDGEGCSVCNNHICEGCQDEHAKQHCFINCDAVAEKKKK